jgi:hypothetical protein
LVETTYRIETCNNIKGAAMKIGKWARWVLAAAPLLLAGCGNFWQNPYASSGDFSLSNSGNMTLTPGGTTGNTSTITVTPASSFTGSVTLTCAVTGPSSATSPATCSLSPTSVSITDTNAQTATLTAASTSTTTTGAYQITVTGVSGSTTETTTVCAEVTTSSGTCTATGPSGTSGPFYVLNQKTAQIAAYTISSSTLNAVSGSPYALNAEPFSMAASPNGFLYVGTAAGIYVYSMDSSSGALTLGNGNGVISSDLATTMTVDPSGGWLLEAGTATGTLNAIALDATTGLPSSKTEQTFTLPATTVGQVTVSPDDDNVFITDGAAGTVVIPFNASAASGSSPFAATGTRILVKHSGGSAISVAVDPSNRLIYVGETLGNSAANSGGIRVFDYTTLPTATEITGSPFASGSLSPSFILPMSSGDTIYVANGSGATTGGSINEFAVTASGSTYTLTAGPVATAGILPVSMAVDNTSTFFLAADFGGNPDLEGYTFDTTTAGLLDSAISSATGTDPVAAISVVAAPSQ